MDFESFVQISIFRRKTRLPVIILVRILICRKSIRQGLERGGKTDESTRLIVLTSLVSKYTALHFFCVLFEKIYFLNR